MAELVDRLNAVLAERYAVEREVGQGGMATVYLARDLKHNRPVALKILRPELAAVVGAERFLNEITVTANLQHPHILPLFDSGEADGFLYYVMPYVEGETLRAKLVRERQLRIEDAIGITKDVASALDYAHRQGVVHRDIKPENIVLHEGRAMVLDFGIALAISAAAGERLTETGLSLGTPSYMSPEQAMGDRNVDARSDVYSLACLVYEMLAGDPPYTGANVQAVIAQVITEKPQKIRIRRDTVPLHIEAALERALSKVPADRYETAGEFAEVVATVTVQPERRQLRVSWTVPVAVVAVVAAVWVLVRVVLSGSSSPIPALTELERITTLPGLETEPTWAPDGRTVVYTSSQDGHLGLWMRQVDGGQALRLGTPGVDEAQPAYSPDGTQLAFVSARNRGGHLGIFSGARELVPYLYGRNGDLFVMPALGGTVLKLADDAYDPSWSPDGSRIAFRSTRDGNWRLYIVSVGDQSVSRVAGVEPRVVGPAWSPDGAWIAYVGGVSTATGWDLYVIPAVGDSSPVQLTFDSAAVALRPSWSPDGSWIAFSSTRGGSLNLWGVPFGADPPGSHGPPERLTTGVGEDISAAVAPDGAGLAYATLHTAPDIWALDPAEDRLAQLTSETTTEDYPRVSPDGTNLLFYSNRTGTDELWMLELSSNQMRQVSRAGARHSAWSPGGNRIAYGTEHGLVIQDLSTGSETVVGAHLLADDPAFSPDGSQVAFRGLDQRTDTDAFVYFPVRKSQLYRASVDGSSLTLIPTPDGYTGNPTWSADGRTIYFHLDDIGSVTLWSVNLSTAEFRQMKTGGIDDAHPAVSPDGTQILFLRDHRDLYVMPVDGGTPRLVRAFTEPTRIIDFPSWTSDGRIVFSITDRLGDLFVLRGSSR